MNARTAARSARALATLAGARAVGSAECQQRRTSQHPDAVFFEQLEAHRQLRLSLLAEAKLGEWYEVKRLLDRGDAPGEADSEGVTALHLAAREGKTMIAGWLLDAGASCDARDASGRSALAYAAAASHPQLVALLLASPHCERTDVNERDRTGATLLHRAAATGAHGMVRQLLRHPRCDPNACDAYGTAPLHKAAAFGHEQAVHALLADVRTQIDLPVAEPSAPGAHEAISNGESALLLAAGHTYYDSHARHTAIAKALLAAGACPNAADKRGRTAAHRACLAGNEGVIRLLLRARERVDWERQDADGRTPFELAARAGHAAIVSALRERGHAHGRAPAVRRATSVSGARREQ